MSGVRWLYISDEANVYKVPKPKNWRFKSVQELAEREVLQVMLYYETKDRKPYKLRFIQFDRVVLDSAGVYEHNDAVRDRAMYNFFNFSFTTPKELAESEEPLRIPLAPVIPLEREKEALYEHLNEKAPPLAEDAPHIVEKTIKSLKASHEERIKIIRKAQKLRR